MAHRGYAALLLASVGFALAAQHDTTGRAADRIVVKFVDDAQVRLRGTALVSLRGADMSSLEAVLTRFGRPLPARTLFRDEPAVDATRAAAESRSGRRLPDLNGYVEFAVDPDLRDSLADALRGLALVETVYRPALPPPPPADIPPPTPDGEADLLYLDPAPIGIDAEYAWTRPGGGGLNVVVTDIEYSWRTAHEDLNSAVAAQRCGTPTAQYIEHGTAVMGELFAGRNGYGTTGIVHQATPRFVTDLPSGGSYNVVAAIDCATGFMDPGDVMLIEAQTYGPRDHDGDGTNDYVPVEWDQANYDAISIATASGVVVVEPAGNGGEDLDHAIFGGKFNRSIRDSGAIVVGAGSTTYGPLPDRSRMDFSTYGSRVDIQGWGDDVGSTGYGDYFDGGGDPNQYYTSEFSGTSSASPMGAGAAAAIEGVQKSCGGAALAPRAVRDLLVQTGTAEVTGPNPGHIGPRPNLRAALARVDSDNDADSYAECEGDCDDARASIYPRAAETNDGLDNQCPGDPGYGVIDETSGDSGFHNTNDRTEYSWTAQSGATKYAVVRSDRATFPSSPTPCTKWETTALKILDSAKPPAAKVYYYLTRPILPRVGSWGQNSAGQERTGICP
jgi:hypothetical protein